MVNANVSGSRSGISGAQNTRKLPSDAASRAMTIQAVIREAANSDDGIPDPADEPWRQKEECAV